MKIVAHRGTWSSQANQNTLPSLIDALSSGMSIETDIRLHEGEIVLSHDPVGYWRNAPRLKDLLAHVDTATSTGILFLNVKEDGLLLHLETISAWKNRRVVFFDMSVPELVRYARVIPAAHLATRWSDVELEPVLYDRCDWLWVDCFEQEPLLSLPRHRRFLQEKKVVFVSPELHGRNADQFQLEILSLEQELNCELHLCRDVSPINL